MRRKINVFIIWFIFTILFFTLGFYHWNISKLTISHFKISERLYEEIITTKVSGTDIDQPIRDFVVDFNSYIDERNETSRKQNRIAALGYLGAALTAIFSMVLVLKHESN